MVGSWWQADFTRELAKQDRYMKPPLHTSQPFIQQSVQNQRRYSSPCTSDFTSSLCLLHYRQAAASIASPERVNFQFDRAAFRLKFWPYNLPYPVPFRLLGDEAKGWLDITYLSPNGDLRISRGNKVRDALRSTLRLLASQILMVCTQSLGFALGPAFLFLRLR